MVPDGYTLELDESFRGPLNTSTWLPYYLQHWS